MSPPSNARLRLLEAVIEAIWENGYATSSVDRICERADVRKGSFYHFFKSKTALAVAALEHLWETRSRPALEEIFSPDLPPLVRIGRLMEFWDRRTREVQREKGRVLGCPYFNVGAEAAGVEPALAEKAREFLDRYQGYMAGTLREACDRGDLELASPEETAGCIFSLMEGCSAQARIHNDPERVGHLAEAVERLLGTPLPADPAPVALP